MKSNQCCHARLLFNNENAAKFLTSARIAGALIAWLASSGRRSIALCIGYDDMAWGDHEKAPQGNVNGKGRPALASRSGCSRSDAAQCAELGDASRVRGNRRIVTSISDPAAGSPR